MKRLAITALMGTAALALAACSEETQDNAEVTAKRAAADAAANAEVIGNELREGAVVAADGVAKGAANLSDELAEDDAQDPDPGDGQLDGAD